jgi:hypothetical protein
MFVFCITTIRVTAIFNILIVLYKSTSGVHSHRILGRAGCMATTIRCASHGSEAFVDFLSCTLIKFIIHSMICGVGDFMTQTPPLTKLPIVR